jgi:hypothetical protein
MSAQSELDFSGARTEQQANLDRVSHNIAGIVADFCRGRFREGRAEFRMEDLTGFVRARSTIAPDSAGRILRDLRRRNVVGYEVVSRSQSLYKLTRVSEAR